MPTAFTEGCLAINYHRQQQRSHPVALARRTTRRRGTAAVAIRNGYCLRSDAIPAWDSARWGYNSWEKAFCPYLELQAPHTQWKGGLDWLGQHPATGTMTRSTVETTRGCASGRVERLEGRTYDVNMMDFPRRRQETNHGSKTNFNLVKRLHLLRGYRLYPDKVSLPSAIKVARRLQSDTAVAQYRLKELFITL